MFKPLLDHVPFFSLLDEENINDLLATAKTIIFSPGEILIQQELENERLLVILEGTAQLSVMLENNNEPIRINRGTGDLITGIGSFDLRYISSIKAQATSKIVALVMNRLEVMEIVRRKPDLVNEIQREMQAWVTDFQGELISKLNEKNQELKRINEELKTTQKANLDVQEMERELQFARQIQKGILPRKLPQIPGFDFGVLMAQARHVGGDFFDFIPLGRDSIGIAIGDVSDKGVPASLFMAVTRSLLRAEAHLGLHPSQVLQRVNYHLMDMNEAGLFVTMVYGVLNVIEKTFSYARAGHEIPLFFTEEYTYECVDYEHGQALGIFHQPVFDENEIRFSKDSFLLLNTDGITDAINETGNAFGIDQLKNVISTNISSSAQSICDRVAKAVTDFAGTSPQFDDLTLVGIKCK